jgi:MYXO-CTERM domain-containing protein
LSLSNGLITALRPVEDGKIIQTNAAISPGSSGGGLFDTNGRLVGITTFAMRSGQGLNMALPVNWVARLGVTGSPRAAETAAQTPIPTAMANMAPPPAVAEDGPLTREAEAAPTPVAPPEQKQKPGSDPSGMPQYVWIAAPVVLLLIWLMRRRREDHYEEEFVPAAPPAALQPFLSAAEKELDQNRPDTNLWNLVIADNKGNMEAARRSYIERRASRLLSEEKDRQWAAAARQTQTH